MKQGDVLFKFAPALLQARLDAELAELRIAELEYNNAKRLRDQKTISAG